MWILALYELVSERQSAEPSRSRGIHPCAHQGYIHTSILYQWSTRAIFSCATRSGIESTKRTYYPLPPSLSFAAQFALIVDDAYHSHISTNLR